MVEDKKNIINRYPGVKPFSANENLLFFGRSNDVSALKRLISINQTVVLYGKSGYGKSSLINAGIIPDLKAEDICTYFTIRFNNFSDKDEKQNLPPCETVKQRLKESAGINLYSDFHTLIPGENSFWYWVKQNQANNKKSRFILFFDQFEELFSYPKEQVTEFEEELSEILYDTIPVNYRIKISELYEQSILNDALHDFLNKKVEIKAVFSIRSDRLSLMNGLKGRLPGILQNCYELDALNLEDAALAIIKPAKLSSEFGFKTPLFKFTKEAVDKILNNIANKHDGKIEAATLQIVCRHVEDNLVAEKKHRLISNDILGNITDIFQQYYETVLNRLPQTERIKAQHLIEDELIDNGRRNPLMAEYIQSKFGLSQNLLAQLEQSSLLRKERDAAGRILYEVGHDTLIDAITKVANSRRIIEEDKKRKKLEQQIEEEKERVEELKTAKDRALNRLKLARIMAAIAIVMMGIAIYYLYEANQNEKNAKDQERIAVGNAEEAKQQEKKANKAYLELKKEKDIAEINRLIVIGDDFTGNRNISRACITYDSAYSILSKYNNQELIQQELEQKQELSQKIRTICGK